MRINALTILGSPHVIMEPFQGLAGAVLVLRLGVVQQKVEPGVGRVKGDRPLLVLLKYTACI